MKLRFLAAALVLSALASCTIKPTVMTRADGTKVASLGGSIFTKSQNETASYTNGAESLTYSTNGHDETVIPAKYLTGRLSLGLAKEATKALQTTEGTERIISGHDVQKTQIGSTERVESLKILNPVEEVPLTQ